MQGRSTTPALRSALAGVLAVLAGCHGPTVGEAPAGAGGSALGGKAGTAGAGGSGSGGTAGHGTGGVGGTAGAGAAAGRGGGAGGAQGGNGGAAGASAGSGGSSGGAGTSSGGAAGSAAGAGGTAGGPVDAGPDGGNSDIVWQYLGPPGQLCGAVAVDSKRVIHVAGAEGTAGLHLRFDENGNLLGSDDDPLAGGTSFGGVAIDPADNVYFAGTAGSGTSAQGYLRWAGVGGTTWGHTETNGVSNSAWGGAMIDSQGRIVVIGSEGVSGEPSNHFMFRRYLPNGTYDLDKVDSTVADWATGAAVDGQDNIYLSGRNHLFDSGGNSVGSTAFLTSWTAAGASGFTDTIASKSSCGGNAPFTNGYAVTFDGAGELWFLGIHCDHEIILRQYNSATGSLVLNADSPPTNGFFPTVMASDGTTLSLLGYGAWGTGGVAFELVDTDLQGKPLRTFVLGLSPTDNDRLTGVAFIGRDRIVVGTSFLSGTQRTWIARLRAP